MGRSVMVHPGAECTAYRTLQNYHSFCADCEADNTEYLAECAECGADLFDFTGEVARDEFDYLVDWIREEFTTAFPSMAECDRWARGCGAMDELRCIVANELCDVYVSEYCGMVAISVVPTGCDDCWDNTTGIARHWCATYAADVLDRFNEYRRIGTFSNGESVYETVTS